MRVGQRMMPFMKRFGALSVGLLIVVSDACSATSGLVSEATASPSPTESVSRSPAEPAPPEPSATPSESPAARKDGWCLSKETRPPYTDWSTYEDPFDRFSFQYPASWTDVSEARSLHSSASASSYTDEQVELCTPWQEWLTGMAKVEFSTFEIQGSSFDPSEYKDHPSTSIDGRPARYAIWHDGDEPSAFFSDATIHDYKVSGVKVHSYAIAHADGIGLSISVWSGNRGDADVDLFWHVIRTWEFKR
jgi:hypothetical protein